MNVKRSMLLRVIAIIGAIAIMGFVLIVANAFVGNPISSNIAKSEIKKYVDTNYKGRDIDLSSARYDIEDGRYYVTATAKDDNCYFTIYYYNGIVTDKYDERKNTGNNTLIAWGDEYKKILTPLLSGEYGNTFISCSITYDKLSTAIRIPDETFNKDLPYIKTVFLEFNIADYSPQTVSELINKVHNFLLKNNYKIEKYNIALQSNGGKSLMTIDNITPQYINQDIGKLITAAQENPSQVENESGIRIFQKSSKK